MKLNAKVILSTLTFTFTALATPVLASGYYTYDTTTASDAAAASVFGGLSLVWICCFCLVPLIVFVVLAYIVYKDAVKNRVENPILWAGLTFLLPLIGILVYYLAIRPDTMKKNSGVSGMVNDVKEKVEEKMDDVKDETKQS